MRATRDLATVLAPLHSAVARGKGALRNATRFEKMRIAVVGGWLALSLATIALACPSSSPGNKLGAEVQLRLSTDSFVGGAQVMVRNNSGEVWKDVVLTVDGEWRYVHPTLRPRDQIVVPASRFMRGQEALPADYHPRRLEVACQQGRHAFELR